MLGCWTWDAGNKTQNSEHVSHTFYKFDIFPWPLYAHLSCFKLSFIFYNSIQLFLNFLRVGLCSGYLGVPRTWYKLDYTLQLSYIPGIFMHFVFSVLVLIFYGVLLNYIFLFLVLCSLVIKEKNSFPSMAMGLHT